MKIFFQSKHHFSTKLTKLLLTRWDEHFDEKTFFKKNFWLVRNLFWLFTNFIKVDKTAFQDFRPTLWRKKSFWKLFSNFLWDYERNAFNKKVPQSCQKLILRVQTNVLMKKNLFWNTPLHFFDFDRIFFWLPAKKILKKIVKTVFYMFKQHFEERDLLTFFVIGTYSDFEQSFSDNCLKRIRKIDKTAF